MRAWHRRLPLAMVWVLLIALASLFPAAGEAVADEAASVTHDACHVEAYLMPDGSLSVIERWTVTFAGTWHGIEWTVDTAHTGATSIAIVDAGEVAEGNLVSYEYEPGGSCVPGTYCTEGDFGRRTCTLNFDKADETTELYVACRLRDAARRWRDASVLDWRLLDMPAGVGVGDVTVDLFLERPDDGGVWPGENVFAWSTVGMRTREECDITDVTVDAWPIAGVAEDTHAARIRVDCGRLEGGDFAQVSVLFPEGWLKDAGGNGEPFRSETFHNMGERA